MLTFSQQTFKGERDGNYTPTPKKPRRQGNFYYFLYFKFSVDDQFLIIVF